MLILTRRVGESLIIGDEVGVTVLSVKGGQVRLGVEAPRDIAIYREEIMPGNDVANETDKEDTQKAELLCAGAANDTSADNV